MSSTVFSSDILVSPFLSLDQIITSLTYSSQMIDFDWLDKNSNFSFFLVPKITWIHPISVLGWVYSYLMNKTDVSRIVYIWSDNIDKVTWSADLVIDHILWKSMKYDNKYYDNFNIQLSQKDFYTDSLFRSTHVFYSRFLENVSLVPIVLPLENKNNSLSTLDIKEINNIINDPSTVCLLFDDYTFSLNEDSEVSFQREKGSINKIFYDYCIQYQKTPHLLQSELLEDTINPDIDIYQWIFAI